MQKINIILFFLCFHFTNNLIGQDLFSIMHNPNATLREVDSVFNLLKGDNKIQSVAGWKQYLRWKEFLGHVDPDMPFYEMNEKFEKEWKSFKQNQNIGFRFGGNWQEVGPYDPPISGDMGRVNAYAVHPSNSDIMYVGAHGGGLWKTYDGGNTYTPLGDDFFNMFISGVVIDPANPDNVYCITRYTSGFAASSGLYKSTDGGATFSLTTLTSNFIGVPMVLYDIIINDQSPNELIVASNEGIFKSVDSGNSWTQVFPNHTIELAYHPTNNQIVYATYKNLMKSTDGGDTWSVVNGNNLPNQSLFFGYTISVTPAEPDAVYLFATQAGFYGAYKSIDQGQFFTLQSDSPNIYGMFDFSFGGQGLYNLSSCASPVNPNMVFTGGIRLSKSLDAGITWDNNNLTINSTHADIQELNYINGQLFNGNDGGLYISSDDGLSWLHRNYMSNALIYRISVSETTPGKLISGWQDNGTNLYDNGVWSRIYGGDGMKCLIDITDDNFLVLSYQNGNFFYSEDNGQTITSAFNVGTQVNNSSAQFNTPLKQNKAYPRHLLIGKEKIFITKNRNKVWDPMSAVPGAGGVVSMDICKSKPDNLILSRISGGVQYSSDYGVTWQDISSNLPTTNTVFTNLIFHPKDSSRIWLSGYEFSGSNFIYETTDLGQSWQDISNFLPDVRYNYLAYQEGSNDKIFCSTPFGVYYRDNSNTTWQLYGTGLPNVHCRDMTIDYQDQKLYTATYGRGVWRIDLESPNVAPVAQAKYFQQHDCPGIGNGYVSFMDLSDSIPTSWNWSFPGGTPSSSNVRHPYIYYPSSGNYNAELVVSNSEGSDTVSLSFYVENSSIQAMSLPLSEDFENTNISNNFVIDNPDLDATWEGVSIPSIGGYGSSDGAFRIENYQNTGIGNIDYLHLGNYQIGLYSITNFTFDISYLPVSLTQKDTLYVQYSNDCEQSWSNIHVVTNSTKYLEPNAVEPNYFVPNSNDWTTLSYNLNLLSSNLISLRFKFVSNGGNNIYIDNINIEGESNNPPIANIGADNNSICEGDVVNFYDNSSENPTARNWYFPGGNPSTSQSQSPSVTYLNSGIYDVILKSSNIHGSDSLVQSDLISVNYSPSVPNIQFDGTYLQAPQGFYSYNWFFNGVPMLHDSVAVLPFANGDYEVIVTDLNGCSKKSDVFSVNMTSLNVVNENIIFEFYPNPAKDKITIFIRNKGIVKLIDAQGKVVWEESLESSVVEYNVNQLSSGVYILKFFNEYESINKRLIVH